MSQTAGEWGFLGSKLCEMECTPSNLRCAMEDHSWGDQRRIGFCLSVDSLVVHVILQKSFWRCDVPVQNHNGDRITSYTSMQTIADIYRSSYLLNQ